MLDALLKSKFYCRCKSEMKLTNKRIEIIKRKRKAMQKFLRNDIADLLKNGLHSNAYGRVEGLYFEQNLTWCYEFVEQSCWLILNHLSSMNKQRECPEECKEAISSLIFAAARFADLPELREVRSLFSERYGNCLEPYVNQEFGKKLKIDPPTKEIKLQMIQEIALESGIEWDSKAWEQNLYRPPPFAQDGSQYANEKSHESLKTRHQNGLGKNLQETEDKDSKKQTEVARKDQRFGNGLPYKSRAEVEKNKEEHKDQTVGNGLHYKPRDEVEKKKEEHKDQTVGNGLRYKPRDEVEKKEEEHKDQTIGNGLRYQPRDEFEKKRDEECGHGRRPSYWSSNASSSSESTTSPEYSTGPDDSASEDLPEGRKFHPFRSMAPPYIKTDSTKSKVVSSGFGREEEVVKSKCKDDNLQSVSEDKPVGRKLYGFRSMAPPYIKTDSSKKATIVETSCGSVEEKASGSKFEDEDKLQHEQSVNIRKPVPRSMRIRRPLKPVSGSHGNSEVSKQSLQFSNGDQDLRDEEEKKMDKLLSHYSRKPSNLPGESGIVNNGPIRSGSLPHEPVAAATEERKGLARAATYQADSGGGHVHPKLPDYDDFVAKLAALRASS